MIILINVLFKKINSLFVSSLGLFSWCKSSSVNGRLVELLDQKKMIEKEKDVCGGLSELDGHFK